MFSNTKWLDISSPSEPGDRVPNEDSISTVQQNGDSCLILCDGLGGHSMGEEASRLDGYLHTLNDYLLEYETLNDNIKGLITGENDTKILPLLRQRVAQNIDSVKTQIVYCQESRDRLQKTLDDISASGTAAADIVSDSINTAKNTIGAAADAAKVAATVAPLL